MVRLSLRQRSVCTIIQRVRSQICELGKGTGVAERLRGILVGLGGRGRYWLSNGLRHPDVTWVAGVEPDDGNRQRAAAAGMPADHLYR
jgi:hypothetical protein